MEKREGSQNNSVSAGTSKGKVSSIKDILWRWGGNKECKTVDFSEKSKG